MELYDASGAPIDRRTKRQKAADYVKNALRQLSPDECISLCAFVVSLVSAGISIVMLIVIGHTLTATENSAKAAGVSARAAMRANKLSRHEFELSRRPWLILSGFTVERGENGNPVRFTVVFSNVGESPALDLIGTGRTYTATRGFPARPSDTVPSPPLDGFPKHAETKAQPILSKSSLLPYSLTVLSPHITDPRQVLYLSPAAPWRFVVRGDVVYRDPTRTTTTRRTCFCLVWKPKPEQLVVPVTLTDRAQYVSVAMATLPEKPEAADFEYCVAPESNCAE